VSLSSSDDDQTTAEYAGESTPLGISFLTAD